MMCVMSRLGRSVAALVALAGLSACELIPSDGPSGVDVAAEHSATVPYALVKLDSAALDALTSSEPNGLAGAFTDRRGPSAFKLGIGDVVTVTVFEASSGGLFIPAEAGIRPGNFVTLPNQTVDNDGNISVPFAGRIQAAGRSNVQVQNEIVNKIKNRAIDPQVVVSLVQQNTSLVSVNGDVNLPLRFAAAWSGAQDRITDAIVRAGGIKGQGFETWVMLERNGRRATVPFENLVMTPSNNIFVQPGDRIYVYREQQKFLAFGAQGQQGEFPFDAWRINLAEAVGKAGGLLDVQADPGSVFVYRREPREVAQKIGVDVKGFEGPLIPVVFSISFKDPGGYFLATRFQMRNQDVVYVANAPSVQVDKFLVMLNLGASTAANVAIVPQYITGTIATIKNLH